MKIAAPKAMQTSPLRRIPVGVHCHQRKANWLYTRAALRGKRMSTRPYAMSATAAPKATTGLPLVIAPTINTQQ